MRFILMTININILVNYKKKIIIGIYINNVIYAAKKLQLFDKFEAQLKKKFEVKLLSKAKLILNILVKRNIKHKIFYLSHIHYIQDLLSIHNMIGANLVDTLIIKRSTILFDKNKDAEFNIIDY